MTYFAILLLALAPQAEISAGKADYQAGEFRHAAAHLERALHADPRNAEAAYWLGRSYETLADIATPFGRKDRSLARTYLTKAVELAPGRNEYRHELFDFLLDTGDQRAALAVLVSSAESDPDYDFLLARFRDTQRLNGSLRAHIARLCQLAGILPSFGLLSF